MSLQEGQHPLDKVFRPPTSNDHCADRTKCAVGVGTILEGGGRLKLHWQRFLFVPLSGTVWGYSLKENLQLLSQTSTASRGAASCFCRAFKVLKVQLKWQLTRATHKCGLKCSRWDARSRNGQRQRRPERSSWGTSHHKQHNIRARLHRTPLDHALIHSQKLKSKGL